MKLVYNSKITMCHVKEKKKVITSLGKILFDLGSDIQTLISESERSYVARSD